MGFANVDHEPPEQAVENLMVRGWRPWVLCATYENSVLRFDLGYGV